MSNWKRVCMHQRPFRQPTLTTQSPRKSIRITRVNPIFSSYSSFFIPFGSREIWTSKNTHAHRHTYMQYFSRSIAQCNKVIEMWGMIYLIYFHLLIASEIQRVSDYFRCFFFFCCSLVSWRLMKCCCQLLCAVAISCVDISGIGACSSWVRS